jgi:uncharacterized protein (DUF1330 family)
MSESEHTPDRVGVIAFESADKAKAWYDTPAIKKINAVRMQVAQSRAFMALTK